MNTCYHMTFLKFNIIYTFCLLSPLLSSNFSPLFSERHTYDQQTRILGALQDIFQATSFTHSRLLSFLSCFIFFYFINRTPSLWSTNLNTPNASNDPSSTYSAKHWFVAVWRWERRSPGRRDWIVLHSMVCKSERVWSWLADKREIYTWDISAFSTKYKINIFEVL